MTSSTNEPMIAREGDAHDDADRHVDRIAPHGEFFELLQHV